MDLDDDELEATRKLINKIRKYKVELTKEQKEKYKRSIKKQEHLKLTKDYLGKGRW